MYEYEYIGFCKNNVYEEKTEQLEELRMSDTSKKNLTRYNTLGSL